MPPLSGLKVVELARVLAGPWAGQLLADLGADVVKIESLAGDDTRHWGPPFVENADGTHSAAYYHACNRGKRSLAVDFSKPEGQAIVAKLIARSDVVIENFKVGGLAKYKLDYASLKQANPRLIYCSITGFGQDGPDAPRPGYDFMIQAMGGIMDLTGEASYPPQKVGLAFVDIFTGVYAAVAVQAALAHREKTGEGQHIDLALLDTMTSVLSYQALNYLVSGLAPTRMGNAHPNIVPYQEFATSDGHLIVAVGNDGQFRHFTAVIGMPELADNPLYATNEARVINRGTLVPKLAEGVRRFRRDDLLAVLDKVKVPVGPINNVAQVFAEPQVIHRGMRIDLQAGDGGVVPSIRSPIMMSGSPLAYERASPKLGEHTAEVLAGLGYSTGEVETLAKAGVISHA
ncbi:MAG TPA: CaiB/BaiF CoA-transferase family protein [Bauldia sp.]|nr:CaiB/BaiF CoA-transferase family protein [Bauldia sp.]